MALGHAFTILAPVLPGGWVFLGEQGKIVAASTRRLSAWRTDGKDSLQLTLLAAPGEVVSVAILPPGERGTAEVVKCAAQTGSHGADAYGDVDAAMTVSCSTSSAGVAGEAAGAKCSCT